MMTLYGLQIGDRLDDGLEMPRPLGGDSEKCTPAAEHARARVRARLSPSTLARVHEMIPVGGKSFEV